MVLLLALACELSHPWAVSSRDDVVLAALLSNPYMPMLTLLGADAWSARLSVEAEGDTCPTFTEADDGTQTITGDCTTTWGYVYGGSTTVTPTATGGFVQTFDHFHFEDLAYEDQPAQGYEVDGSWAGEQPDGGESFVNAMTLTTIGGWAAGDPLGAPMDVTATYASTQAWDAAWDETDSGSADIAWQSISSATGDFCSSSNWAALDTCPSEGDGLTTITGSRTASLTWDCSTSCDGCADVVIDGIGPAGSYCL